MLQYLRKRARFPPSQSMWFFFAMALDSAHEKRPVGHLSI